MFSHARYSISWSPACETADIPEDTEPFYSRITTPAPEVRLRREQQTATAEILRTISSSPTDVQPMFQTILDSAKRLLGAFSVTVAQRVGDKLHLAALSSVSEAGDARVRKAFPFLIKEAAAGRPTRPFVTSILSRQRVVVSDAQTQLDIGEGQREVARARGFRSQLVVPLLREHRAIGVISVTRREAGGFIPDEDLDGLSCEPEMRAVSILGARTSWTGHSGRLVAGPLFTASRTELASYA
jgi:two-component system, NtrC family, sensor kinase